MTPLSGTRSEGTRTSGRRLRPRWRREGGRASWRSRSRTPSRPRARSARLRRTRRRQPRARRTRAARSQSTARGQSDDLVPFRKGVHGLAWCNMVLCSLLRVLPDARLVRVVGTARPPSCSGQLRGRAWTPASQPNSVNELAREFSQSPKTQTRVADTRNSAEHQT